MTETVLKWDILVQKTQFSVWTTCSNSTPKRLQEGTSRERPKSAPYLRLKKTRKPLFLQLETKALEKLNIEKKNFRFFLKFLVSRIGPKNVKGRTLWDFLNILSVAKYQKLMGGIIKKFGKKIRNLNSLTVPKKGGKSHSVEKSGNALYLMLEALEWLFISC